MGVAMIINKCVLWIIVVGSATLWSRQSAVTYTFSGGRLGDNLIALMHAEWISYKHDIPLRYKSFPYSDQLSVHELRAHYNEGEFSSVVELKKNEFLTIDKNAGILYVIPYFPESLEEHRITEFDPVAGAIKSKQYPFFAVDWEDKTFKKRLQDIFAPRFPLTLVTPPEGHLSIAVQVRRNSGGFDLPLIQGRTEYDPQAIYVDRVFPLKHPPHDYYIQQIKTLLNLFPDKPVYIFLFTDDPDPKSIADMYFESINNGRVIIDYRRTENNHYSNVLEDFFSMVGFDCLIRPDSNLSIALSKLGNFKALIVPITHRWEGTKLIIEKVSVLMQQH